MSTQLEHMNLKRTRERVYAAWVLHNKIRQCRARNDPLEAASWSHLWLEIPELSGLSIVPLKQVEGPGAGDA